MKYLLFPGRHLINTQFQADYLAKVIPEHSIDKIVFAITSANQENSRYNPIDFPHRLVSVDRFGQAIKQTTGADFTSVGIPHYPTSDRFVDITFKEIEAQSQLTLSPENTLVLCSTPSLIAAYETRGYQVVTAEYDREAKEFIAKTPIEIIKEFGRTGIITKEFDTEVSRATKDTYLTYPHILEHIVRLYQDPLVTDAGDLTDSRNYNAYAYGMNNSSILELKYKDIDKFIKAGRIVDEGCADGALLSLIAKNFPDSDLIGIDITPEFIARGKERQRMGEFGEAFVHFYQRNILNRIFTPDSIDTTICNSTLHEIWSYGNKGESVRSYLRQKFEQTKRGGRLLIRDVVGPEKKDTLIAMTLNSDDGSNKNIYKECASKEELKQHLEQLSTKARFLRFSQDFIRHLRFRMKGKSAILRMVDASEFMSKFTYTDNWTSELHEEFAFWSFSEWNKEIEEAGFKVSKESLFYTSPYQIENRWVGKISLFSESGLKKRPLAWPPTNMVIVAEKG